MSEKLEPLKNCDLEVTELRSELEKRDLDKRGVKAILSKRLHNALLGDVEDSENNIFDKFDVNNSEKSPCDEKKKQVTPTKTIKKSVVGRRPGPKSKTCMAQVKVEKISINVLPKENDEVNLEQADSGNAIASSEDSTRSHDKTKELDGELNVALIDAKNTDSFIVKFEASEIKGTKSLDNLNIDEELDHEVDEEENDFNQITYNTEKSSQEHNKDDNNEDSINLTIGEDDIKLFADEEDTNIEKEDEGFENHTQEKTSLIKQRESRHPITASSSKATTGLVKSHHNATEKRSSVGDKPRSIYKEDKDISNAKPIVSVPKEEEKQIKDKVEAGIKQSNDSKVLQISSDTSKKNNSSLVRNIWVSGLASITKATDLKHLFSKYGKVVGAKVVTNAKTPGTRCYGFVTLSSAEDANHSIENLHNTELHGCVISVERAKRDNVYQMTAKSSNASKVNENSETEQNTKQPEEKREKRPEITVNDVRKPDLSTLKRSSSVVPKYQKQEPKRSKIVIERDHRKKVIISKSNECDREKLRELEREKDKIRQQEILNLEMKTERDRLKIKEQERALREEDHKRRIEKERQLETERKQKEEAIRLEKERQKLQIERERIEKEKSELMRLERENQRFERERLQREKEELRKAQEKLEETKRQTLLKRAMPPFPLLHNKRYSSSDSSRYEERKEPRTRIHPSTDYRNQATPPPPNITSSRHRCKQHTSDSRHMKPSPLPTASRPKDSTVNIRYGAQPAIDYHYRSRDDRSDRKYESRRKDSSSGNSNRHGHTSYDSNKSLYGMSRNSVNNTWSSDPVKSSYSTLVSSSGINDMVLSSKPDLWSNSNYSREIETTVWQHPPQPPPEKWNSIAIINPSSMSISGHSLTSNTLYENNYQIIPNMGLTNMSTNYNDSRFDRYKMSGMSRKY